MLKVYETREDMRQKYSKSLVRVKDSGKIVQVIDVLDVEQFYVTDGEENLVMGVNDLDENVGEIGYVFCKISNKSLPLYFHRSTLRRTRQGCPVEASIAYINGITFNVEHLFNSTNDFVRAINNVGRTDAITLRKIRGVILNGSTIVSGEWMVRKRSTDVPSVVDFLYLGELVAVYNGADKSLIVYKDNIAIREKLSEMLAESNCSVIQATAEQSREIFENVFVHPEAWMIQDNIPTSVFNRVRMRSLDTAEVFNGTRIFLEEDA